MSQEPKWISYSDRPPTEQDADEDGRVLVQFENKSICAFPITNLSGWSGIKWWLPLPKLPPEPEQDEQWYHKMIFDIAADDRKWNTQEEVAKSLMDFAARLLNQDKP